MSCHIFQERPPYYNLTKSSFTMVFNCFRAFKLERGRGVGGCLCRSQAHMHFKHHSAPCYACITAALVVNIAYEYLLWGLWQILLLKDRMVKMDWTYPK